jgi:hypothetical protein
VTAGAAGCRHSFQLPEDALLIDLDAERGVTLERGFVSCWESHAAGIRRLFEGRRIDGRPTLSQPSALLGGRRALTFVKQELVHYDDAVLSPLTTGLGYTWLTIVRLGIQQPGWAMRERDLNAIFGNLRNGQQYEGFWAGVNEDGTLWAGPRNGCSFGRWNADNPQLLGPRLEVGRFYLIAGRLGAGVAVVSAELFVDGRCVAQAPFRVNPDARPSRLAVGQERDATDHPGKESFIGEVARLLIWGRPLSNPELAAVQENFAKTYGLNAGVGCDAHDGSIER